MKLLFLSLFFLLSACSSFYHDKNVKGADEFVLDSYKIREGKYSILEMKGEVFNELTPELFEESEKVKQKVYIAGNVLHSSVGINGKTRLFDVLAKAKIDPKANLFKSYVSRNGEILKVDFFRLLKKGDMSQNIVMKEGDKIYIADLFDASLTVIGNKGESYIIPLMEGSVSLKKVLVQFQDLAQGEFDLRIVREGTVFSKVYFFDHKYISGLSDSSVLLMPEDRVYILQKPISKIMSKFFKKK